MRNIILPALLAGMLAVFCTACDTNANYDYGYPAETYDFEETTEPTTEQPTLSSEEISGLLAATAATTMPETLPTEAAQTDAVQTERPEDGQEPTGNEAAAIPDLGTAVYLSRLSDDSERFFFFYGQGNGSYLEQETGMGMGFTYEMQDEDTAVFHIGDAASNEVVQVYRLDDATIELSWESGEFETLRKWSDDPFAEFSVYSNEVLRERAMNLYEQKTSRRPSGAEAYCDVDGRISIRLYDDLGDHITTDDWYTVDRFTGIGTNLLGETIDLSDGAAVPTPETETTPF